MPKASRRLSLAVGEAGGNIQRKSESGAAIIEFILIRVNPNNPWLKNTDLTDLTDFRFALRGGGCGACDADGGV